MQSPLVMTKPQKIENDLEPIAVSELILLLKRDIEEKHCFVLCIGEISSFKVWRSGHAYFDIKDDQALMPAVIFRPFLNALKFDIRDGQKALFKGKVSIYAQNSRMQLLVESIEPLGQGALLLAFKELKEKLFKEGLFDDKHKKPLPKLPKCVGIITSIQGAALRDMVRILKTKSKNLSILLFSVRVQGQNAKEEIAQGINFLDKTGRCDVIIVGRGGGSLEDLFAFNEEIVARAIFNAKTPIVSAVGHETDFTICDLVADVRAATPTHAADLVVPDHNEIIMGLNKIKERLKISLRSLLNQKALRISYIKKRLFDPRVILYKHWQDLDKKNQDLNLNLNKIFKNKERSFYFNKNKFISFNLEKIFIINMSILDKQKLYIKNLMFNKLKNSHHDFKNKALMLDGISPLKVLLRGYGVIEHENKLIKSAKMLNKSDLISITFFDGKKIAQIME